MAVLQEHPTSFDLFFFDHLLGDRALTLAERSALETFAHSLFFGETLEIAHWIGTSGKHEDKRNFDGAVLVALRQVEGRRDDILFAHFLHNEVLDGRDELIRTETLERQEPLETVEFRLVRLGPLLFVSRVGVIDMTIFVRVLHEMVFETLVVGQCGESCKVEVNVVPGGLSNPGRGVLLHAQVARGTHEEVSPLSRVNFATGLEDLDGQQEGKEKFMLLEQGATNVFIEGIGEIVVDVLQTDFVLRGDGRVLHTILEQFDVPLQRVLIHRVDIGEIQNAEEEQGCSECH